MSKARKNALEKFPILFGERTGYDKTNLQQERRNAYEKGYRQSTKDICQWLEDNLYDELAEDLKKYLSS